MNRLEKWLKTEFDVEMFSAVHWISMAWCYAFIRFCFHQKGVSFFVLTEMGIVAYLMSWGQRLLYLNEALYKKIGPTIRRVLWVLIPFFILYIGQEVFRWFLSKEVLERILYDGMMLLFFIIVEVLIHLIYKEDTKVLNDLLKEYQGEDKKDDSDLE